MDEDCKDADIESSVKIDGRRMCFENPHHHERGMSRMYNFYLTGQLTDVTLVAGNYSTRAHRIVLSSASVYFSTMFNSNLRESKTEVIELGEIDGASLKAIVRYAYTGQLVATDSEMEGLLSAACFLRLNEVARACSTFVEKQLDQSNCLGIALFAESRSCNQLKEAAFKYISENFLAVSEKEEFLNLQHPQLAMILRLEELNVPSEILIFKALLRWLNYDREERAQYFDSLLEHVKLPMLSPSFISKYVMPVVGLGARKLIIEALEYHLFPEKYLSVCPSYRTTPRRSTLGWVFAIGGVDLFESRPPTSSQTRVEAYSWRYDRWSPVGSLPSPRQRLLQHAVVGVGRRIYVAGGRDGLRALNNLECYDMDTQAWSSLPGMTSARSGLALVALRTSLYAIGGYDGWSFLSSVERWDPETRTWTYVEPMNKPRSSVGAAALNDKIYAIGGRYNSSSVDVVEVYDPLGKEWKMCSPMLCRRGGVSAAALNGFLYAFGGHDLHTDGHPIRHQSVERYDPRTDSWEMVATMRGGREGLAVCVVGSRILTAGGFTGELSLSTVQLFDPFNKTWTELRSMELNRAGHFLAAVSNEDEEENKFLL